MEIWVPIYSGVLVPNKINIAIAGIGLILWNLIYWIYEKMGIGHAEDNKLDTFNPLQKTSEGENLMFGKSNVRNNTKVSSGRHDKTNRPEAEGVQSKLNSRAQAAKSIETRRNLSSKSTKMEPRDLTAYIDNNISKSGDGACHSNIDNNMKDRRENASITKNERANKQTFKEFMESQVIRTDGGNKYRKLNKILGDKTFLELCYGKPGNKSNYFENLSNKVLKGKFKFSSVEIPKTNKPNKTRPLGTPSEKILQTGIVELLKNIYEPLFLDVSHGFRSNRSVKSALGTLYKSGGPYVWVIQGNIYKFFDNIPHQLILNLLRRKIDDVHFIKLIERLLKAGYIENGRIVKTDIGTPQGSPVSPILSNIVLHEFDSYVMNELKDNFENFKGARKSRSYFPEYDKLTKIINGRIKATNEEIREARLLRAKLPSKNPMDPKFKRLLYVRYADDFVILVIGSKEDAINIRSKIKNILEDRCKIILNIDKTLITHIREGFNFLGAHIRKLDNKVYKVETTSSYGKKFTRFVPLKLFITAPILKIINKLIENKFARRNHLGSILASGRKDMILKDHFSIIRYYNFMIQGLLNFFSFAGNYSSLHRVFWILRQSCALTLANKFKLRTMKKAFDKFGFDLKDPETGIKLKIPTNLIVKHQYATKVTDRNDKSWEGILSTVWSKGLTYSNKVCAICESTTNIEMHHIRKIADIRQKIRTGNASWSMMNKRKQVPLCKYHHVLLHRGGLSNSDITRISNYNPYRREYKSVKDIKS